MYSCYHLIFTNSLWSPYITGLPILQMSKFRVSGCHFHKSHSHDSRTSLIPGLLLVARRQYGLLTQPVLSLATWISPVSSFLPREGTRERTWEKNTKKKQMGKGDRNQIYIGPRKGWCVWEVHWGPGECPQVFLENSNMIHRLRSAQRSKSLGYDVTASDSYESLGDRKFSVPL